MNPSTIKQVQLDKIQRPKTLIVLHYKNKRISIPLFKSIDNITEYLLQQLHKFQTTVLDKQRTQPTVENNYGLNQIVRFTAWEQDKNKLDIKMNILLSMVRLEKDYGKIRSDIRQLDITGYYKFMEIVPYYGIKTKQLIPEYQLFSVLRTGAYYTIYLGRKISDGRFYSVKICKSDTKISQNQYNAMRIIHHQQAQFQNKNQLELIPQIEQIRKTQGLFIYISEFCAGGTLKNYLNKKLSQIQCLHYMKQLIWGIHTLHNNFNLIHRALCFQNLQVDFVGNLRLTNYAYCQPCFSTSYLAHSNVPESYQEKYQINNVVMPPEVQRSSRYNNLVDYFGIGVVLSEMFIELHPKQNTKKQKEGIQVAIQNLMAENIRDRELFVNEIISQLHQQKMKVFSNSKKQSYENIQHQRLKFNKIYTGESINIQEKVQNGIRHQQALKIMKPSHDDQFYYLNPVKKSRNKSKNKSKSKGKSKDKSNQGKSKQKSKQKTKQNKEKSKSKQKTSVNGKPNQSNSLTSQKSQYTKKSKYGSQKSLDKSIDSRNHSQKSKKSNESVTKKKDKNEKSFKQTEIHVKRDLPKIPISPKHTIQTKSPTKNIFFQTAYPQTRTGQSPPKIIGSKSKNKL